MNNEKIRDLIIEHIMQDNIDSEFWPLTNILSAFQVLNQFKFWNIDYSQNSYRVTIECKKLMYFKSCDKSLTLAICKAALKTKGIKI